ANSPGLLNRICTHTPPFTTLPSATNEKDISIRGEAFDASWVAGSRRAEGTGGTDLSHSVTSLSASGDNPPFLHPTPSLPAPHLSLPTGQDIPPEALLRYNPA
ncbi:hypothetical protein KUCAC02_004586, partial [Chaenocephalus aceratus]